MSLPSTDCTDSLKHYRAVAHLCPQGEKFHFLSGSALSQKSYSEKVTSTSEFLQDFRLATWFTLPTSNGWV